MPENTLTKYRDQLAQAIFDRNDTTRPPPALSMSPWVAMSMLQKSLRRDETRLALQAAATLFQNEADRVWRRLAVTAFEDVGQADIEAVYLTTAALAGKRWRAEVGGEWAVAEFLIRRLAAAPKCRAVDDGFMIAEKHPHYAKLRLDMTVGTIADSLSLLNSGKNFEERCVAVWSVNAFLREGRGKRTHRDPFLLLEAFSSMGVPVHVLGVCIEGFKKTRETLPLLFPLIYLAKPACGEVVDDELPAERFSNGVPLWAADYFTREGREAFRRFLLTDCRTAQWIRANVPRSGQIELVGMLTFALEGGLMRKRLRWELADRLRATWERECLSRHCPDGTEILALMTDDLHVLNDVRASCL
jgi:hypothetical protein